MAASFWAESKRVSNARIKTALGVTLAYPTYREGLRAVSWRAVKGGSRRTTRAGRGYSIWMPMPELSRFFEIVIECFMTIIIHRTSTRNMANTKPRSK